MVGRGGVEGGGVCGEGGRGEGGFTSSHNLETIYSLAVPQGKARQERRGAGDARGQAVYALPNMVEV